MYRSISTRSAIRALNTVTVRAQVDGKLIKVAFREGQDVKRGDVLAEIDPRTYQAQYDQAVAKKAQDEATLANARARPRALHPARRVEFRDEAAGRHPAGAGGAARGAGASSIRRRSTTRARSGYTKIVAPIDGRTGIRMVDEGNIVRAGDATGIVMITQIRPIAVLFSLPQQQLARSTRAFGKGPLKVEALGTDGKTVVDRGTLAGDRQPGRSDHRHGEAEGRVSQRQPAALARPVRQRAPAGRDA